MAKAPNAAPEAAPTVAPAPAPAVDGRTKLNLRTQAEPTLQELNNALWREHDKQHSEFVSLGDAAKSALSKALNLQAPNMQQPAIAPSKV